MQAYRVETTVAPDGSLTLSNLPFLTGERVEVIVRSSFFQAPSAETDAKNEAERYPLRGMPIVYHDPFEPAVPESDWEIYR
ncbi:MAG: hypothetical protein HYR56_15825 [Acidobacteria bacterium]|nr:hypothetical protein [Acidobacteriota bacterium]MBI3425290.1 hypothetical protein [Acidobacteriota bacterium]